MTPTPTPLPTRVRRRPPKLPLCYPHSKPVTQEKNKLYYGDNYEVLQRYVRPESVDLIYLDPPFNSRQDYNVLFAEKDGTQSSSHRGPRGQVFVRGVERSTRSRTPGSGTSTPYALMSTSSSRVAASPTPCAPSTPSSAAAT